MHFSLLSGQEYAVPGMFIANSFDQQPAAMPVAPFTASATGAGRPSGAGARWTSLLFQGVGAAGWHLHGDQYPERIQQDLPGGIGNQLAGC